MSALRIFEGSCGFLLALLLNYVSSQSASTCSNPKVASSAYVASDATFHFSTAFVVEFSLKCANDAKDFALYAEVNGRLITATVSQDGLRYQVSWTSEHEKAPAGYYKINLHTEDGYAAVRKAQRNNEQLDSVTPLATITFDHIGASKGQWIQSPIIAAGLTGIIFYLAHSWKGQLMS